MKLLPYQNDLIDDAPSLLALLEWHVQMDLTDTLGDEAIGYISEKQKKTINIEKPSILSENKPNQNTQEAYIKQDKTIKESRLDHHQAVKKAELVAKNMANFDALKKAIMDFKDCDLVETAAHCFIGEGRAKSPPLMVILPTPDYDEDRSGAINSGDRGQFIKALLQAIDYDEHDLFTGFSVFWRPPGERSLTKIETRITAPFFRQMLYLINPDCLMIFDNKMGDEYLPHLYEKATTTPPKRQRGSLKAGWYDFALKPFQSGEHVGNDVRQIPCYIGHRVEYYLKNPVSKADLWPVLLKIKK